MEFTLSDGIISIVLDCTLIDSKSTFNYLKVDAVGSSEYTNDVSSIFFAIRISDSP